MTCNRGRPELAQRTSTATTTSALVPRWRPPWSPCSRPPTKHSSTSTGPVSGALRIDHGAAQLVQHHPSGLVAFDAELALELDCRDATRFGAHQVSSPEPQVQRRPGAVQDRAGGQRELIAAGRALSQEPPYQQHRDLPVTARAAEPSDQRELMKVVTAALVTGKQRWNATMLRGKSGLTTPKTWRREPGDHDLRYSDASPWGRIAKTSTKAASGAAGIVREHEFDGD